MHTGKSYKLLEFLAWTRRDIYRLIIIGTIPVVLYQVTELKWLSIPWTVVALLGTATAFIVGFKNTQTYNRTWEGRQIWGEIVSASRYCHLRWCPRIILFCDEIQIHTAEKRGGGAEITLRNFFGLSYRA